MEQPKNHLKKILSIEFDLSIQVKMDILASAIAELCVASQDVRLLFFVELNAAINKHETSDSHAKAHKDGRLLWRSWAPEDEACQVLDEAQREESKVIPFCKERPASESASSHLPSNDHSAALASKDSTTATVKQPLSYVTPIGCAVLEMLIDPEKVAIHETAVLERKTQILITSYPSTLLYGGGVITTVWSQEYCTAAALLPQNLNAAVYVAIQVGKRLKKDYHSAGAEQQNLDWKVIKQADCISNLVTRPVLFFHDDLGSSIFWDSCAIWRTEGLSDGDLELDESTPTYASLRANAIFFQSYAQNGQDSSSYNHSELFVKYRKTGSPGAPSNVVRDLTRVKNEPVRESANDNVNIPASKYLILFGLDDSSGSNVVKWPKAKGKK
jgi:hypothetical protein